MTVQNYEQLQASLASTQLLDAARTRRVDAEETGAFLSNLLDSVVLKGDAGGSAAVATASALSAAEFGQSVAVVQVMDTGAVYRRVDSIPAHGQYKTAADGFIYELRPGVVTPQMFGAAFLLPGLGVPSDSCRTQFQAFYTYCGAAGVPGYVPPGQYLWAFTSSNQSFLPAAGMAITWDAAAKCWLDMSAMWAWADVANDNGGTSLNLFSTDFDMGVSNWSLTGLVVQALPGTVWAGGMLRIVGENIYITRCKFIDGLRQGIAFLGGSTGYKIATDATIAASTTLLTSATAGFKIEDVGNRAWLNNASVADVTDGVVTAHPDTALLTRVTSASRAFLDTDVGQRIILDGKGPSGTNLDTTIAVVVSATAVDIATPAASAGTGLTVHAYRPLLTTIAEYIGPTQVNLAAAPALTITGASVGRKLQFTHFGDPVVIRDCVIKVNPAFSIYESGGGVRVIRGSVHVFNTWVESHDDCLQTVTGRAPYSDVFGADTGNVIFQNCRGGAIRGKFINVSTSVRSFNIADWDADADGYAAFNSTRNITFINCHGYAGLGGRISNDSHRPGVRNVRIIDCTIDCAQAHGTDNFGWDISGKVDNIQFSGGGIYNPTNMALNIAEGAVKNGPAGLLKPTNISFTNFYFDAPRLADIDTAVIGMCEDVTFTNCTFKGGSGTADVIHLGTSGGTSPPIATRVKFDQCKFLNIPSTRRAVLASGSVDCEIINSRVAKAPSTSGTIAVRVGDGNTGLRIAGNDMRDTASAIVMASATSTVSLGTNKGDTPTDPTAITSVSDANLRAIANAVNTSGKSGGTHKRNSDYGGVLVRSRGNTAVELWDWIGREFDPITPA